jgi:hypothetical protein
MSKLLCVLLTISLIACTSKGKAPAVCTATGCPFTAAHGLTIWDKGEVQDTIQEEDWQFSLSGYGWTPIKAPGDIVKVVFLNSEFNTVVFFAKEPTTQDPAQYTINALRTFHYAGTVVDATYQTTINDNEFVLVSAHNADRNFWTWINVHKGAGYVFSCAVDFYDTPDGGAPPFSRCNQVAATLKFQ